MNKWVEKDISFSIRHCYFQFFCIFFEFCKQVVLIVFKYCKQMWYGKMTKFFYHGFFVSMVFSSCDIVKFCIIFFLWF